MPILRDFERRLGGLVEGLFAKTFRAGLQPVELAKRVLKEMEQRRTVGVRDVWAPNHFVFELSPPDAERFEQAERALMAELSQVVRDNATERGWGLVGPAHVEFMVDRNLKKGEFHCEATLVEGDERVEPASAAAAELVVLEGDEPRAIRLTGPVVTIGRLDDCDVVIHDAAASRRHAQVRVDDGSFTLTDLGSTNGTLVNGRQVQTARLVDGDRIRIGSTVIEFREGSA